MPEVGDIATYTNAIQAQGIFHLAYLPNDASCALDRPEDIARMIDQLGENAQRVSFVACASKANGNTELSEISMLISSGAKAIYFGRIIENETLFKQALTYVDMIGVPIVFGPMTKMEANGAHLNAGETSFEIGIRGESEVDELSFVQQVLSILELYPTIPVHFQCISSIQALELIYSVKQHRSNLTVGVSPFHLVFSDEYLRHYNQKLKFNPPLRSPETMRLLKLSLMNGRVDHLTSLHHPMLGDSQEKSFFDHSFGSETIDSFFHVVSHCLLDSQLSLDYYHALLSCPMSLSFVKPKVLGLNSNASFIVLKAVVESMTSRVLFGDIDVDLHGGILMIVNNGEILHA